MFECVINISEGTNLDLLDDLSLAAGDSLRDRHSDPWHNRSVFTLINDANALLEDVHHLLEAAVARLNVTEHAGVHPRLGVVDVVPFVPLDTATLDEAVALRDATAEWVVETLGVPVYLYGPVKGEERTLPFVRKHAGIDLSPDVAPSQPHPTAGAMCLGARHELIAWNMWISGASLARTKELAAAVRGPGVRTLGLAVGAETQVSCNIVDVAAVDLSAVYQRCASLLHECEAITRCELVGLIPERVLLSTEPTQWAVLDIAPARTIAARVRGH